MSKVVVKTETGDVVIDNAFRAEIGPFEFGLNSKYKDIAHVRCPNKPTFHLQSPPGHNATIDARPICGECGERKPREEHGE